MLYGGTWGLAGGCWYIMGTCKEDEHYFSQLINASLNLYYGHDFEQFTRTNVDWICINVQKQTTNRINHHCSFRDLLIFISLTSSLKTFAFEICCKGAKQFRILKSSAPCPNGRRKREDGAALWRKLRSLHI